MELQRRRGCVTIAVRGRTSRRRVMTAGRVAVAAPNRHAAEAGVQAAADGGNAVDAALAAMLVALVSEPGVASVGGGAFVTIAPPGRRAVTVDGTVAMPGAGLPRERFGRGL